MRAHKIFSFRIRGHYPLGRRFPATSAMKKFCNLCRMNTALPPYNPGYRSIRFGLFPFRSPLLSESRESRSIYPKHQVNGTQLVVVFFSSWYWDVSLPKVRSYLNIDRWSLLTGFPHSDTSGSKVTNHLPEAFRWLVASFIAVTSLGIHRAPFMSPVRKPEYHI